MKKLALAAILFASILAVSAVGVDAVDLTLASRDLTAYSGDTTVMEMTIINTRAVPDQFSIDIWPTYWDGISVVPEFPRISMSASSQTSLKLYFSIPIDAVEQRVTYNITAKSVNNPNISAVQMMDLWVMRSVPIYISDITIDKPVVMPKSEFLIQTSVTNVANDPYFEANLQTNILKGGVVIQSFASKIDAVSKKSTLPIEVSYSFDKYAEPGVYTIQSQLKDNINRVVSTKESTVTVKSVYNISFEKRIAYGLLLQTISIDVKNEGNTPNTTVISEIMPSSMKPFVFPAGATSQVIDNMIYYDWYIQNLGPGETRTVSYQINLWSAWAVVAVMIVAIMTAFNIVYVPGIVKDFRHSGPIKRDKQIQITLEAKNKSMREIRDVTVRDFVPAIVKVVDRFDTVKPQMVRRLGTGTEIIWKFEFLKPREERVLTYWIVPSMDIPSSLKLSKAFMRYVDRKKLKKVFTSKNVEIKSA